MFLTGFVVKTFRYIR